MFPCRNKPLNLTKTTGTRQVWNKHFGDLNAEPLGIPGDRIATLIYRLAVKNEHPQFADPKVSIIFIGINDVVHKTPDIPGQMDFLLTWIKNNMPATKIVLQALLNGMSTAIPVNQAYEKLAEKHNILWSTCGQDIKKMDRKYMADLLHPNFNGQTKLLGCLSELVQPLLDSANAGN